MQQFQFVTNISQYVYSSYLKITWGKIHQWMAQSQHGKNSLSIQLLTMQKLYFGQMTDIPDASQGKYGYIPKAIHDYRKRKETP